jgi:hypothetical protein
MPKTRKICIALSLATLIQFITACNGSGDGVDNLQSPTDTTADQSNPAPQQSANTGAMFDVNSAGAQGMQSLHYIAEAELSFGATTDVYSATDKYRMQSRPPALSTGR